MPPRSRRTAVPLLDLEVVRAKLADGRAARVRIAPSAQFPEGATGLVRRLGNPESDGEEFVFVEVAVGGVKDVVPFAPADLADPAARARGVTSAGSAAATGPRAASPRSASRVGAPATDEITPSPGATSSAVAASAAPNPTGSKPVPPKPVVSKPVTSRPVSPPLASKPGPPAKERKSPARARRAPITITVHTDGGPADQWQVQAAVGAKVVAKPTTVSPARVWEIVQTLQSEALAEVVGGILAEHRRATQERVSALTAELSALQAELRSLPTD